MAIHESLIQISIENTLGNIDQGGQQNNTKNQPDHSILTK